MATKTKTKTTAAKANTSSHARISVNAKRVPANGNVPAAKPRNEDFAYVLPRSTKPILESLVVNGVPTPLAQPAHTFLTQAAETIQQRAAQRDNTGGNGERSMAATVAAFNVIEGTTLTERQGWAFMQTLKLVRAASSARNGVPDLDSHIDGAGYAALAGECVARGGAQA